MGEFKKTEKQCEAVKLFANDNNRHVLLFGGSRSGKTFITIRTLIIRACKCKSRHIIFRLRNNAVKRSVFMNTLPEVMRICFPDLTYDENKSELFITLPNGSEIWCAGLDNKERVEKVLGNEYSTIYYNECSEIPFDSVTVSMTRLAEKTVLKNRFYYDCNPPSKSHWSYKLFIEKQNPESGAPIFNPDTYASMLMNPTDNAENISDGYIEEILSNLSEREKDRFLSGKWLDDAEGALFKRHMIEKNRGNGDKPDLLRIVIGVDPAVTSNENSDLTGIVVVGVDKLNHFYVLDDRSLKASPNEWAKVVVSVYNEYQADRVIAEVNQGGDLVEMTIRNISHSISYKAVRATRGKVVRAEPIAALYEQNRVHHLLPLVELEDEMCSWVPDRTVKSPDRVDALVWALTELSGKRYNSSPMILAR